MRVVVFARGPLCIEPGARMFIDCCAWATARAIPSAVRSSLAPEPVPVPKLNNPKWMDKRGSVPYDPTGSNTVSGQRWRRRPPAPDTLPLRHTGFRPIGEGAASSVRQIVLPALALRRVVCSVPLWIIVPPLIVSYACNLRSKPGFLFCKECGGCSAFWHAQFFVNGGRGALELFALY